MQSDKRYCYAMRLFKLNGYPGKDYFAFSSLEERNKWIARRKQQVPCQLGGGERIKLQYYHLHPATCGDAEQRLAVHVGDECEQETGARVRS